MPHWVSTLEVAQVNKGLHYFGIKIPCAVRIIEPFQGGERIFFHGLPKFNAEKFTIALRSGLAGDADVCLQIDVDCQRSKAVFGTCENGEWWFSDERLLEGDCILECDKPFLLELTASADGYDVALNNSPLTVVNYKVSPAKASHIVVSGDLRLPGLHFPLRIMTKTNAISIPGDVHVSSVFTMTGRASENSNGFSINFQSGESSDSDIAFHFNPRFNMAKVIRNHRVDGDWGEEETIGGFPFSTTQDFSMMIVPRPETYHIWVDGSKFASFAHRMDLTKSCVLNIEGEVKMYDISIDCPPDSMPAGSGFEEKIFQSHWKKDLYNPPVPVVIDIEQANEGDIFCMSGVVEPSADRFNINFQADAEPTSDVLFHYNPRFHARQVILNTRVGDTWSGNEVRWDDFPFRENSRFEIIMSCNATGFLVSVNNESPRLYPLEFSFARAKYIVINGDITVKRAVFMGNS